MDDDAKKFYYGDSKEFDPLNELSPVRREQLKNVSGSGKRGGASPSSHKTADANLNMPTSVTDATTSLAAYKIASFSKTAEFGGTYGGNNSGGGGGSVRTIPRVYSPLFELSNLQLPRDRRTLNAWCRHFYSTHPLVRNCINLHATFPISKFEITCDNKKIETEMNELAEDMRLLHVLYGVALVYWMLGEAFPYGDWNDNDKTWRRWVVHNPDYVDVKYSAVTMEPLITLQPDDTLKRLVRSNDPKDKYIRATLPKEIIYYISRGQNIPLDSFNVTHVKFLSEPYDHRGTSIIASCFKDLMLYDLLRESEYAQAANLINPITHVKLVDPLGRWRPTDEDLAQFRDIFVDLQFDLDPKLITHGAVQIEKIGNAGGIIDTTPKLDRIIKNIMAGLMVPEGVITGEGPNYCYDEETETLTKRGFKRYDEIVDTDEIATFNPETKVIEYHHYKEKIVNYYSGNMISFKTRFMDIKVTPNHRMYVRDRKTMQWETVQAADVKVRSSILDHGDWVGHTPETITYGGFVFTPKEFINLVFYTWTRSKVIEEDGQKVMIYKYAQRGPAVEWKDAMVVLGVKYDEKYKGYVMRDQNFIELCQREISSEFDTWKLPRLIGDWSKHDIYEVLNKLAGRHGIAKKSYVSKRGLLLRASFALYSKELIDFIQELFFKCGYSTRVDAEFKPWRNKTIYRMNFSHAAKQTARVIDLRSKGRVLMPCKSEVPYDGIVYCFDVPPNHLFVTRRNGLVTIQGNSTASVGLEVLRQRYLMFRDELEYWIRNKVIKPIAVARDWTIIESKQKKLIIPKIQWNKLTLKDLNDYMQKVADGFNSAKVVSRDSYLKSLDLDPEEELANRRKEMLEDAILAKEKRILESSAYSLTEMRSMTPSTVIEDRVIPGTQQPASQSGGGAQGPDLSGGLGGGAPNGGGGGMPDLGSGLGPMSEPSSSDIAPGGAPETGEGAVGTPPPPSPGQTS
jgi:hypothetical protein